MHQDAQLCMGAAAGLPGFSLLSRLQPEPQNALYPWMGQKLRECHLTYALHTRDLCRVDRETQKSLEPPYALSPSLWRAELPGMSGETSFVLGIRASLNRWHWEDVGTQEEGRTPGVGTE